MPSYIECVKDEVGGLDHPVVTYAHFFSPLARRAVGAIIAENKTDGLSRKVLEFMILYLVVLDYLIIATSQFTYL